MTHSCHIILIIISLQAIRGKIATNKIIRRGREGDFNMLEKAGNLLNEVSILSLASINEDGYPRTCTITKLQSEGARKIYVCTGMDSKKTKHFRANPKASICYYKDSDSVILLGAVNIVECMELKKTMWQDWLFEHIPGGVNDPNYCLLEFVSCEATMYIQGEFATMPVK